MMTTQQRIEYRKQVSILEAERDYVDGQVAEINRVFWASDNNDERRALMKRKAPLHAESSRLTSELTNLHASRF